MDKHQTLICKTLKEIGYRHGLWKVFSDWVAMMALAISNAIDKTQFDEREAEYMRRVKGYTGEEVNQLAQLLGALTASLDVHHDALGEIFMALELGNKSRGQFFTPYPLSLMMAQMVFQQARPMIESHGFITVIEPACGAGGMVIAAAEALLLQELNYQQCMHVTAIDIDITAVHMCYVQLSLLHIPAKVVHGNALNRQFHSLWYTPAHVMGFWPGKLKRRLREAAACDPRPGECPEQAMHTEAAAVADHILPSRENRKKFEQMALF